MKKETKEVPMMWGDSIVGFGTFHYKKGKAVVKAIGLSPGFHHENKI
jgi:hypothetical protein